MSSATENLISAVFVRRALWDQKDKNHHNGYMLNKLWDQVAEELHYTRRDTRSKWKNIRDKFRIELVKQLKSRTENGADDDLSTEHQFGSSWQYFDNLMFLKDQFTPRQSQGNLDSSTEDPATLDPDEVLLGMEDASYPPDRCPSAGSVASAASTSSRKRCQQSQFEQGMNEVANKILQLEEKKLKFLAEEKSNKKLAFFESLLPHIDKLPDEKKLLLMMEIQQVVYRHVYGQSAYQQSSVPVSNTGSNLKAEVYNQPSKNSYPGTTSGTHEMAQ